MIHPFEGYLIRADRAHSIVSPAYDSLTTAERRRFMDDHPDSFLHVTRSPQDAGENLRTPLELARANAAQLDRLLTDENYEHLGPSVYLYRLVADDHEQTAIVAEIPLDRYEDGTIRPHERTNVDREDLLALHMRVVGASSSPVAMTYRDSGLAARVAELTDSPPRLDFTSPGGLWQQVWRIDDPDVVEELSSKVDGPLYVTDGHHRLAAAARVRTEGSIDGTVSAAHELILSALFPDTQLRTYAFHRIVQSRRPPAEVLELLRGVGSVTPLDGPPQDLDGGRSEFAVVAEGRWYHLALGVTEDDVLDVSVLQRRILAPVFHIDATTDPRLGYLPGTAGLAVLAHQATEQEAVGFALGPPPVGLVLDVADRGEVLPPKSTFFSPKPRSGVFVRRY